MPGNTTVTLFWTQTGTHDQDIARQELMAFQFPSAMCLHFRTSIGKGEVFNIKNNYEYFLSIFRMGMWWPHHLLQQTRWTKSTICCVNAQNLSECSNRCCSAWRERWKVGQDNFLLGSFVVILLIRLNTFMGNNPLFQYLNAFLYWHSSIVWKVHHYSRCCWTFQLWEVWYSECFDIPWWVILVLLFHRFIVDVSATKDREFITINCNSRSTSEVTLIQVSDDLIENR